MAADSINQVVAEDVAWADAVAAQMGEGPINIGLSSLGRLSRGELFQAVFGRITFRQVAEGTIDGWAWTRVVDMGEIWVDAVGDPEYQQDAIRNTLHELGHALAQRTGWDMEAENYRAYAALQTEWNINPNFPRRDPLNQEQMGYAGLFHGWQQSGRLTSNEEFADMFLGWVYNRWADDAAGQARATWMTTNMANWIELASR